MHVRERKTQTEGASEWGAVLQHAHAPRLVVEILGHKPLWLDWTLSQIGSSIIERRSYFPVLFIRLAKQLLKGKKHCS